MGHQNMAEAWSLAYAYLRVWAPTSRNCGPNYDLETLSNMLIGRTRVVCRPSSREGSVSLGIHLQWLPEQRRLTQSAESSQEVDVGRSGSADD